jgi:hypothetical protein
MDAIRHLNERREHPQIVGALGVEPSELVKAS